MAPKLVSRDTWLKDRIELLAREKAFNKDRDALTEARRNLPMVEVTKEYTFAAEDGPVTLRALFAGKRQLVVYHFMYGPDWEAGCRSCSYWLDNFNGIEPHLGNRDTRLVLISNASIETLQAYRARMGWDVTWVSALGTEFGTDFGVSFPTEEDMNGTGYNYGRKPYAGESPGVSVFYDLGDGRIAHSYSTYGRGLDMLNGAYHLLDITPIGRNEGDLQHKQAWIQRHDEYV